jgi:Holliday junction resolvase RusA-like endonuclease
MSFTFEVPYFGDLSVNRCWIRGRGGVRVNKLKPQVELWMSMVADKVKGYYSDGYLVIRLKGKFKDERAPDLDNLHKVLSDALKVGLGVDDKNFRYEDLPKEYGYTEPTLEVELLSPHEA